MKKRLIPLFLCALLLTGCTGSDENSSDTAGTPKFTDKEISEIVSTAEKSFRADNKKLTLTDEEWKALLSHFGQYSAAEPVLPKECGGTAKNSLEFKLDGEEHTLDRIECDNSSYIRVDGGAEYPITDDAEELFERYCAVKEKPEPQNSQKPAKPANAVSDDPADRLIGLSVECDEPTTYEEYLAVSRKIVAQWLDSLKSEKGEYRLKSYTFTDDLNENRVFHGDGYVNGGREFVCYVAFDAPEKENTVFYAAGTYDKFYHYYFGPGVLARFRWENGVCSLIDYDEAYAMLTSGTLKSGLYGIKSADTPSYKTFYDFFYDKEYVEEWLAKDYHSYLCGYLVSHNVMMLSNGNIVYMDIGNSDIPKYEGDHVTTDMHQYFYSPEDASIYSSPVDYIDGSGAVVMTYRLGFPIVYDDYNHDGNPDYAIRVSSDENGSKYDVRCMDINGTPWEDNKEIYIPGEFAESIRLQISDRGGIFIAGKDDPASYVDSYPFSDKSNTEHHIVSEGKLQDYRMYSQRFFLPESLRSYTSDDKEVICYFWNNTAESVTAGGEYEIQRLNGKQWETVSTGKQISSVEVSSRGHAELGFDISDLADDRLAVYRVKINVNGKDVYGGFYYGDSSGVNLEITGGEYHTAARFINFKAENNGLSVAYPKSITLFRGSEKVCEADVELHNKIDSGGTETISIFADDVEGGFTAGEYSLVISTDGGEFSGTATLVEVSPEEVYFFPQNVPAQKTDKGIELTLTNGIWNKQTAAVTGVSSFRVLKDGVWQDSVYAPNFRYGMEIGYGESGTVVLESLNSGARSFFDKIQSGDFDETMDKEYLEKIKNMTFEDYLREVLRATVPEAGDLCRVTVEVGGSTARSEYVYFKFP